MKRSLILVVVLFPLLGLAALLHTARLQASPPAPSQGSVTFTVNSTVDATDVNPGDGVCETAVGNGVCTLRAAVQETNALITTDTIILPTGTYTLTIPGTNEDLAATGDLDLTGELTLVGMDDSIVDADQLDRVFHILSGAKVTISDITARHGATSNTSGGGILNSGTTTILGSAITDNQTMTGFGGGIVNTDAGVLTITDTIVDNNINLFGQYGGGIQNSGLLRLVNSSISTNNVNNGSIGTGGGIFNTGNLIVENSVFLENYSGFRGGGIANSGVFTVNNSTFSDNSGEGGGIYNSSYQLSTITMTTFSNNVGGGISNEGNLVIANVFLENNNGSAIRNSGILTITMGLFTGNSNSSGGGIYNSGSLAISDSHFEQNIAASEGGGIYSSNGVVTLFNSTLYNNSANYGGGVSNGEATMHIVGSTLYHNSADVKGGGIYNSRAFWPGVLMITNTTLYTNSAPIGGGISNEGGHVYSVNNTVYSNVANSGGGINNADDGLVQLTTTIIANHLTGGDCGGNAIITSAGYNIASDSSCNLIEDGDMPDTDPVLGPLQDNGGATWTHALMPGSPAIDAGHDLACPATDQRGIPRPLGEHCDIGAYEYSPVLVALDDEAVTQPNIPLLLDVLANDIPGTNGDPMLVSVGEPMSGTAVITNTFILYTPDLDFTGTDHFTYTITDGVVTDTAVVTVTVQPLTAPTAVDDTAETNQNEPVLIDVLANDVPGSSGDPVLVSVGEPGNGTAVITDTFILYTPAPDFFGTDTFTYTITDGVLTDTAVVTVTVLPVDDQTYIYLPVVLKPEE